MRLRSVKICLSSIRQQTSSHIGPCTRKVSQGKKLPYGLNSTMEDWAGSWPSETEEPQDSNICVLVQTAVSYALQTYAAKKPPERL